MSEHSDRAISHEVLVLVEVAGRPLAFTREAFVEALARGRELVDTPAPTSKDDAEGLLTAEEIAARTGIPAQWYLAAAREGRIAHHRIGRYRRFSLAEVAESSRFRERGNKTGPQASKGRDLGYCYETDSTVFPKLLNAKTVF